MAQLPAEISHLIIDEILAQNDLFFIQDIAPLATISRLFLEHIRLYIFRDINLTEDAECEKFWGLLSRFPHLSTYVRDLSVTSGQSYTGNEVSLVRRCSAPIASIISSTSPYLRVFSLGGFTGDWFGLLSTGVQKALLQLFRSPNLIVLDLHNMSDPSIKYLSPLSQLKKLYISHSNHVESDSSITTLFGADIQHCSTPLCLDVLDVDCNKCVESLCKETYSVKNLTALHIRYRQLIPLIFSTQQSLVSLYIDEFDTPSDLHPPSTCMLPYLPGSLIHLAEIFVEVHYIKRFDFPNLQYISFTFTNAKKISSLRILVDIIQAGKATARALKRVHISIILDDSKVCHDRIGDTLELLDAALSHPRYSKFEKAWIILDSDSGGGTFPTRAWFRSRLPLLHDTGRVDIIA